MRTEKEIRKCLEDRKELDKAITIKYTSSSKNLRCYWRRVLEWVLKE